MATKRKYLSNEILNLLPFKKDLLASDKEKEELHNFALISLRRVFKKVTDSDKRISFKMLHFNKLVHSKYSDDITNVIKMYLKEDQYNLQNADLETNKLFQTIKKK